MSSKIKLKKKRKNITLAVVHIKVTFNNTIVTFTDSYGNTISSSSAGGNNFKGAKKSTPYAAQVAVNSASTIAKEYGVRTVCVKIKGAGSQREAALRAVFDDFVVTHIMDISPIPHNGTKAPKRRRV